MWPGVATYVGVPAESLCWPLLPSCDSEAATTTAPNSSQYWRF